MRLAIPADVHGNLPAPEAVLADFQSEDVGFADCDVIPDAAWREAAETFDWDEWRWATAQSTASHR